MPISGFDQSFEAPACEAVETAIFAVYCLDRRGRFTYINRAAERLWRRSREDLLSRVIWEAFPAAVGTAPYMAHQRALAEQRTVTLKTVSPVRGCRIILSVAPISSGLAVSFIDLDAHGPPAASG